jgi:hypothetical protein
MCGRIFAESHGPFFGSTQNTALTACVVVAPFAGTGMLAMLPVLIRDKSPVVPTLAVLRVKLRLKLAAEGFEIVQE